MAVKLIKAYLRYRKLEEVYKALNKSGYCCMTFVECEGTGQYCDHEKVHISDKYSFAEAYRVVKLEIVALDENILKIIKIIKQNGRTGYCGDGIIIISPVDEVFKVRTDEKGVLAL
jgi:nitrogen regulatory protein P-II 1